MQTNNLPRPTDELAAMGKKYCYISGPISNTVDYKERFAQAEKEVEALGMIPVNPVTLPHIHDQKWSSFMKEAIAAMMRCECVYFLKNWVRSEGAVIELNLSQKLEFDCYYQSLAGKTVNSLLN